MTADAAADEDLTQTLSDDALERLRAHIGSLTTAVNQHLEVALPWYLQLTTDERASLRLISQRGIQGLLNWLENPEARHMPLVHDLLGSAPTDLMRSISLQRALQLIRSIVEEVERRLPGMLAVEDRRPMLEAILRYSREVAFGIADVYARAAESRGAWDSRLEALLVDAVLRGESKEQIDSRASAVGWRSTAGVVVVVGRAPEQADAVFISELRRHCVRFAADAVVGVQGDRLVLLLGGVTDLEEGLHRVMPRFGDGFVVYARTDGAINEAPPCAQAAYSGFSAAPAWRRAPHPTPAEDLLPERALAGDDAARQALRRGIYDPLEAAGNALLETVGAYVEDGHSLEATARELFVHPNTVRYRLRRVCDLTGWDPVIPRDAYVLQTALAVGRL
ncbi:PucR family transcriptional regulator [Nesterenkonia aerolata]|uniref:Helix-turn-helix domain-containing protein n=1 Tax=Nesterenkonia aerolata TaxID=3074079 RepID=A0ABU2DV16_9MICC|nr:helix-turn-helix domain-containing protein [Nesterenkonia sp. LY-0111]MDR8020359.1 helix-turn-helix domain-containing protein [Nesterenkonia sp. LY-0111]